jgi:hypothetical protein
MLSTAGLSLEQAPPIHIPFRFFLTAPLFLLAAALLLALKGDSLLASRWSPAALAVTHLIVVGFLGQVMSGALLQMLPVVAGSPVPSVRLVGGTVNPLLAVGAGMLAWGLLGGGGMALSVGAVCASLGFLVLVLSAGLALLRARGAPQTVRAMGLALGSLLVAVVLGLVLTEALSGRIWILQFPAWVDVHLAWGLLGWVGLLVMGVAFQVVPMFHVTPPYPKWLSFWLPPLAAAALLLGTLRLVSDTYETGVAATGVLALAFSLFALVTLGLQARRERKRVDATLLHWWSAMVCVLLAALCWLLAGPPVVTGILLLLGAGVGVVSGMLFKIVPFLAWFHLQHRQLTSGKLQVRVPNMLTFLPDRPARLQLACHLLALVGTLAAWAVPVLIVPAGIALALSAALLGGLILRALVRFRRVAMAIEASPPSTHPEAM